MQRELPLYSQLLDIEDAAMRNRACGATALAMVLAFHRLPATPDSILALGKENGAYIEERGWLHRELAGIARSFGTHAHSEDWSGDDPQSAWEHLEDTLARAPAVVSVRPAFSPSESSHLIAVASMDSDEAVIYDPFRAERDAIRYTVTTAFLREHWTQRIICVHPPRV